MQDQRDHARLQYQLFGVKIKASELKRKQSATQVALSAFEQFEALMQEQTKPTNVEEKKAEMLRKRKMSIEKANRKENVSITLEYLS